MCTDNVTSKCQHFEHKTSKRLRELRRALAYLAESRKECVKRDGSSTWSEREGLDCVAYSYKSRITNGGFNSLRKVMEQRLEVSHKSLYLIVLGFC